MHTKMRLAISLIKDTLTYLLFDTIYLAYAMACNSLNYLLIKFCFNSVKVSAKLNN